MKITHVAAAVNYLFWDCVPEKLDITGNREFIISRILEKGDIASLQWLFKNYNDEEIKTVSQNSRLVTSKTSNFWRIYFSRNL